MTSRQQWSIVGAIVLVLAIGLGTASYFMREQLFPVTIGSNAPDFRAKVLGANQYKTMADYKGQVVVLNVWATWCPPCKAELPSLQRLYQEYGPKGLKLVAVSIDDYVGEDSIRKFTNSYGLTFEMLHDSTHAIERIYQTTGYPETFVIGPEGTIRKKWIGPDDWSSQGNRALIAQLLGLPTPRPGADSDAAPAVDLKVKAPKPASP
jgi:cytochrome c biogenesis protein CcmG/thiol:disulfide interchange protein DsbE